MNQIKKRKEKQDKSKNEKRKKEKKKSKQTKQTKNNPQQYDIYSARSGTEILYFPPKNSLLIRFDRILSVLC